MELVFDNGKINDMLNSANDGGDCVKFEIGETENGTPLFVSLCPTSDKSRFCYNETETTSLNKGLTPTQSDQIFAYIKAAFFAMPFSKGREFVHHANLPPQAGL